ncbi:kinase-like domain-containing protein [Mycena metata]|uniref:Kinase-like domain-containing protein n=1 Tax=Mycena metata TaxID=1033252 RepID=A0AAD7MDH6_9AGAR|nr:kinase-like domain-containing protein [Mycena metata]
MGDDVHDLPVAGEISFVVDDDPHIFDTGVPIKISYERNPIIADCEENLALDGTGGGFKGLRPALIAQILASVEKQLGWQTHVTIETHVDGGLLITHELKPLEKGEVLSAPFPLPVVALSSLRATHRFENYPHIFVVNTITPEHTGISVFKAFADAIAVNVTVRDVEFMSRLPVVDFLLRPTHVVLDGGAHFRGFLMPYHPASSISQSLSSNSGLVLQRGSNENGSPVNVAASIDWSVKLAWVTDIGASVAWLHTQAVFWGDLKTENIVLCHDGHCRLIDYVPGGMTVLWCAPEMERSAPLQQPTAEGDVFALGLVLWAVIMEVGTFQRQVDYVSPGLVWNSEIPPWFQRLSISCLEHTPALRPSARCVYDALVTCTWPARE